jgi:hypothetical protein
MEILLAKAAPRTPSARVGIGYRTALHLHGLCQEFSDGTVFICRITSGRRIPARADAAPFQRTTTALGDPDCTSGRLRGYVVRRDERALDAGQWHRTGTGLPITGAARTLIDCWLRPSYGLDDERWGAAWRTYWEDERFGSRVQKSADLMAIHRSDGDARVGRAEAFARLVEPYAPMTAREILGSDR